MKGPTHNRFHFLAIRWLRDEMNVVTDALPTNKVAMADEPERARIDGHVLPASYQSRLGWAAIMLLIVAGTAGMGSVRPGLDPTLDAALGITAIGSTVLSVALLVFDWLRRRRLAHAIDMMIQAGPAGSASVGVDQLESWLAAAQGQLWVVAERGYTAEALSFAHAHDVRCFSGDKHGFAEVHAPAANEHVSLRREAA